MRSPGLLGLIVFVAAAFAAAAILLPHSPTELRALVLGAGLAAPAIALAAWIGRAPFEERVLRSARLGLLVRRLRMAATAA